jgi:membrane fusion protein (multidrug efflux system)
MKEPVMRLRTFLLLVAALGAAGAYAWRQTGGFAAQVGIVEARRGTAAEIVYATGVVEPARWAKVMSLQRKRIVDLCDCEGKTVQAGDVLARLDDSQERAALAEFVARRDRLAGDVARIQGLVKLNAAPQTTLDQTTTQLREYEARIDAQKERIDDLVLRAPMSGTVLRRDGEVGEIAGTGANDVLFWVGQPKPLRIVSDVNEEDVPRVRQGQKVLLRAEGFRNRELLANVGEITPKGDPATKTFRVYLNMPDDSPLMIGMSVEANIVTQEKQDALLLPAEALQEGAAFVVVDDRLRKRAVKTGLRGTRMVEILDGVKEGELVATPAKASWREGMRVRAAPKSP